MCGVSQLKVKKLDAMHVVLHFMTMLLLLFYFFPALIIETKYKPRT